MVEMLENSFFLVSIIYTSLIHLVMHPLKIWMSPADAMQDLEHLCCLISTRAWEEDISSAWPQLCANVARCGAQLDASYKGNIYACFPCTWFT